MCCEDTRPSASWPPRKEILSQAIYQGFGPTPPDECLKLGLHGPNELLKFVLEHKSEV